MVIIKYITPTTKYELIVSKEVEAISFPTYIKSKPATKASTDEFLTKLIIGYLEVESQS